jgi:uncharacterized protein (TIGR03435 family)
MLALAQSSVTFEAASVKASPSGQTRMSNGLRGRTYTAVNMPLRPIILSAYEINAQAFRLVGGPSWVGAATPPFLGDRFDITATLPDGTSSRDLPAMLRALLAERFKLAVHMETRETPMYALVVARADGRLGPRLRPATVDCNAANIPRDMCRLEVSDKILGRGRPIKSLADVLAMFAGRAVVDRTGLAGVYDFELEAPEISGGPAAAGPGADRGGDFFTVLPEQLGLKLTSIKSPLEFVVIDSVEHPTEN